MITRLNKNVISIKNIPSNLIEEAIFILKTNDEKEPIKEKSKDIIMKEADSIIKECSTKLQEEISQKRLSELKAKNKLKKIKVNSITLATVFVIISLIIYLIRM